VTETALPIVAYIDGHSASREKVLAWERARAVKVARKLGLSDSSADVAMLRRALVDRKLDLGHAGLLRRSWLGRCGSRSVWQRYRPG
jgi:hypothetical protein